MRPSVVGAGAAVIAAAGVWVLALRGHHEPPPAHTPRKSRAVEVAGATTPLPPHTVMIRGVVRDERQEVVPDADVVLRGPAGAERIAKADHAGAWSIAVAPATYHIYARRLGVLAVGPGDKSKLDDEPLVRPPDVADDALVPTLEVGTEPLPPIDISVIRAATVTGTVFDDRGEPLANATVRARPLEREDRGWLAPVLGSDVGHTDAHGEFALAVAPGKYQLETAHPKFTTGIAFQQFEVAAGDKREANAFLFHGCQIEGKVITADGKPASDGSITRRDGTGYVTTTGNHGGDGTFRLTTSDEDDVTLLAWPWGSPPSAARTFTCADGATYKDVTFRLPANQDADAWGVLTDAAGQPVPLAYIEVEPLDSDAPHQQERTDANGAFRVFGATWGRFRMTASAAGKGIAALIVTMTAHVTDFELGGTGRIAGTVTGIADGSFEAQFESCADNARASTSAASQAQAASLAQVLPQHVAPGTPVNGATVEPIYVAHEPRIVPVRGGRFAIDGAPACALTLTARWRGVEQQLQIAVTAGATTMVELALGRAEAKQIYGVVRSAADEDSDGAPIPNAQIVVRSGDNVVSTTTTDTEGRYTLHAVAGEALEVTASEGRANAQVGLANVGDEQIDFAIGGHANDQR